MDCCCDVVYIFKRTVIDNTYVFVIKDIVVGRYDSDSQKFIGSNGKIYDYILFARDVGFGLRNFVSKKFVHINDLFDTKVYFYFEFDNNIFKLIMCINDNIIVCDDMDLNTFNFEYQKMCNEIVKKKKDCFHKE